MGKLSREIEFRGVVIDEDEDKWIYGCLSWPDNTEPKITPKKDTRNWFYVCSWTVGQYTGLKDINGTKIYEGDIVDAGPDSKSGEPESFSVVHYQAGAFCIFDLPLNEFVEWDYDGSMLRANVAVVGNIHDNPELLPEEAGE
ncbi:MAG: YopX family protein [Spirochaetota bacterium]|jgi:uncharacterized phage protein (TIGR01671 family)|nr:YopX family protein [Spirochaetota bacterium]